ncbi:MAG: NTP transferase domain-containing protein [Deltaproteobacteria bacterium]|nr:NTP transferase domain-containing protein [Deltaproteobacteria bacterium]
MPVRKAVIPAGGLGTRLYPLSLAGPKELLPLGDRPAIHHVVAEAAAAGIETIILVLSGSKWAIADYFAPPERLLAGLPDDDRRRRLEEIIELAASVEIIVVTQRVPRGLGHAVGCAATVTGNEPFLVFLPDDILTPASPGGPSLAAAMRDLGGETGQGVLALRHVPGDQVPRYGIAAVDREAPPWQVLAAVEKPARADAPSDLAIMGRYLLPPRAMELLREERPSVLGEIQLTPVLDRLAKEGSLAAVDATPYRYWDLGSLEGFRAANAAMALEDPVVAPRIRAFLDQGER